MTQASRASYRTRRIPWPCYRIKIMHPDKSRWLTHVQLHCLLFSRWINREQLHSIEYLPTECDVPGIAGRKRLHPNDDQRSRLAVNAMFRGGEHAFGQSLGPRPLYRQLQVQLIVVGGESRCNGSGTANAASATRSVDAARILRVIFGLKCLTPSN